MRDNCGRRSDPRNSDTPDRHSSAHHESVTNRYLSRLTLPRGVSQTLVPVLSVNFYPINPGTHASLERLADSCAPTSVVAQPIVPLATDAPPRIPVASAKCGTIEGFRSSCECRGA